MNINNETKIYSIKKNAENTIKRGDICICDFDKLEEGTLMFKKRPVLAITENHFNSVTCIPFTTSEIYNLGIGFNLDSAKVSYPRYDKIVSIPSSYLDPIGLNILTRYHDVYTEIIKTLYNIFIGDLNIIDRINLNRSQTSDIISSDSATVDGTNNKCKKSIISYNTIIEEFINKNYQKTENPTIYCLTEDVYNEFKKYWFSNNYSNYLKFPTRSYFDMYMSSIGYRKVNKNNKIVFPDLQKIDADGSSNKGLVTKIKTIIKSI